jgi:hypothetical protein
MAARILIVAVAATAAAATASSDADACASACSSSSSSSPSSLFAFFPASTGGFGLATCSNGTASTCTASPATAFLYAAPPGNSTAYSSPLVLASSYDSISEDGTVATALLATADGAALTIVDTLAAADAVAAAAFFPASLVAFTRTTTVVGSGNGSWSGFATRLPLQLSPAGASPDAYRLFMPGLYYNDGGASTGDAFIPGYAIGGNRAALAAVAREDRLGAPLALLVDPTGGSAVFVVRPRDAVPDTVFADTLQGGPVVDGRMAFASLGPERCGIPQPGGGGGLAPQPNCTALAVVYPGCEYVRSYQSGTGADGSLWRFHPLTVSAETGEGFSANLTLLIGSTSIVVNEEQASASSASSSSASADALFLQAMDWSWRAAVAYFAPPVRDDINMSAAHEALVASLADSYTPASPIPGVPTGFDKMTGVPYSTVLELGFVGPQVRMAVALLQSALATGNASRAAIAAAMLDGWVAATGPGYGHAVWDMGHTFKGAQEEEEEGEGEDGEVGGDTSAPEGKWIDDAIAADGGGEVYLRRHVISHRHALEAAALGRLACANAAKGDDDPVAAALTGKADAWEAWGLSLADVLVALQASNGSWSRQYEVPPSSCSSSSPGCLPRPTDLSPTATALPLRYLVEAYRLTGNSTYLNAAIAAGEYAWAQYGSRGLYVGGAIDNPDVVDKESALFAMDGFLALHEATEGTAASSVPTKTAEAPSVWAARAASAALVASTWAQITRIPNPVDHPDMDFASTDTSVGIGLIAVGHSGSDTFASMLALPYFSLCALAAGNGTGGDALLALFGRLALANTKQGLDLDGSKGYAMRGYSSELWSFSVGWDIFSGHNDGRGIGDPHWVPWTSANGAYGVAAICWEGNGTRGLPPACQAQLPTLPC